MNMQVSVLESIQTQLVPVSKVKPSKSDAREADKKLFDNWEALGASVADGDFQRAKQIAYLLAWFPLLKDSPKKSWEAARDAFKLGFVGHYAAKLESEVYALDKKGVYKLCADQSVVSGTGILRVRTLEAVNMSKEDYSLLKEADPAKRAVFQTIRERVSDYTANRWMRLVNEASTAKIETLPNGEQIIAKKSTARNGKPNQDKLDVALKGFFDTFKKRAKQSKFAGQINLAVYDGAVKLFMDTVVITEEQKG